MATEPALGTRIKRARERKRWTQRQLADALGVNIKTIDNWENDRRKPRSAMGALEQVLGPLSNEPEAPGAPSASTEEAFDRMQAELDRLRRAFREQRAPKDEGKTSYARRAI